MRMGLQTAALAVLVAIAIVYFAVPARAAESCTAWVTDMQDEEGGPVLMTHVCSDDSSETWLAMTCYEGKLRIDHDLALGGSKEPTYDETAEVEFVTDGGIETVPMTFQAMTAMFGGEAPADGRLVELLKTEASLTVRDKAAAYPAHTYSLDGSSAALTKLVSACR